MADFECKVLLDIEKPKASRGGETRFQVIQWGKYPPVIEKRVYFEKEGSDDLLPGKLKGINLEDMETIRKNYKKIKKVMEV